jgi:hypothetical protein
MKRTWTIIGVADVPLSFKRRQSLLDLPETARLPTATSSKSSSRMGRSYSASTSGAPTSIPR